MNSRRGVRFGVSSALIGLLSMLGMTAKANLILNGSFENPTPLDACQPANNCVGSFRNFSAGDSFDGWMVVGSGQMSLGSTDFTQLGFTFPAQEGQQWADLSGFGGNDPVGIQQTIATVVGDTYDVSFWVGNTVGVPFGVSSTIEIFLNGASLGQVSNSDGDTTTAWGQFTVSFQADNAASTIAFFNRDPVDDNMNGLDNVVATARSANVPEPATLGMLGVGAFGLGFIRLFRRRRRLA